jgi:hypothetical protein
VFFEPGEQHWHGAAPTRFMTHLAMLDVDDGNSATWAEQVSDEEYGGRRRLSRNLTFRNGSPWWNRPQ